GSRCPSCGRRLSAMDLVPVLSWVVLRGRCRTCHTPISARYPLVELLMAGVFVAMVLAFPPEIVGYGILPLLAAVAMLGMAALIGPGRSGLPGVLPSRARGLVLLGSFLWRGVEGLPGPLEAVAGALAGGGILVLLNRV